MAVRTMATPSPPASEVGLSVSAVMGVAEVVAVLEAAEAEAVSVSLPAE